MSTDAESIPAEDPEPVVDPPETDEAEEPAE